MKLTPTKKLELVWLIAYSVGQGITSEQAIAAIASLFPGPPGATIDPDKLPELLSLVSVPRKPRRRLQSK